MKLRLANSKDEKFLWEAQYHAAHLDATGEPATAMQGNPVLARYVEGWGRAGDIGVIAEFENRPVGAAWCRLFQREAPGWGWIDEQTPEISVAVLPQFRQQGLGISLLIRLLEVAGEKNKMISFRATGLAAPSQRLPLLQYRKLHCIKQCGRGACPARHRERRTALISAAVTGKIDVRNW